MDDLIGIALRASVMYAYALATVRLMGKRSVGALSPADLMATFIVGDMFDDIFWAEVPLAKGIVGVTAVALVHLLVEYATHRSTLLDRVFSSSRAVLVRHGQVEWAALRSERVNAGDLQDELRLNGIDDRTEVREASLEPDGKVSVLKEEWAKPAEKRDLPALREALAHRGGGR